MTAHREAVCYFMVLDGASPDDLKGFGGGGGGNLEKAGPTFLILLLGNMNGNFK